MSTNMWSVVKHRNVKIVITCLPHISVGILCFISRHHCHIWAAIVSEFFIPNHQWLATTQLTTCICNTVLPMFLCQRQVNHIRLILATVLRQTVFSHSMQKIMIGRARVAIWSTKLHLVCALEALSDLLTNADWLEIYRLQLSPIYCRGIVTHHRCATVFIKFVLVDGRHTFR